MSKVSIIIPTYNRAYILSRTLDSVAAQTFQDWECLVVDDFSTDNTKDIVLAYCEEDQRFRYLVNERKKGAQGARNTGLMYAQSDWVQFFDSDDVMHNDLLEILFDSISEKTDVYTCFSNIINSKTNNYSGQLGWICEGNIQSQILSGECYVDYNGALIRKEKLVEIGGIDEECPSMQEWDTHIRLSHVAQYHTIQQTLIDYYVGGDDTISINREREVQGYLYIMKKHKSLWNNLQDKYVMYGKRVVGLLNECSNTSFKTKCFAELHDLIPRLHWLITKDRFIQTHKSFRHNIAKRIKNILKKI